MSDKNSFLGNLRATEQAPAAPEQNTVAQPTINPTQPTEPIQIEKPQTVENTEAKAEKVQTNNSFFNKIGVEREEVAEPPKQKPTETPQQPTTEAPKSESENLEEVKLSPEMQKAISVAIVEGMDYIVPKSLSLYSKQDYKQYKADEEPKKITADGIRRLLDQGGAKLTPWQQIIMGSVMAYIIPAGMVFGPVIIDKIMGFVNGTIKQGKPINTTDIKQMQEELAILKAQQEAAQYDEPQPPTAAPTQPQPTAPTNNNIKPGDQVKNCKECNTLYKVGEGYPINPKSKHFDSFCGKSCLGRNVGRKGNQIKNSKKAK